MRPHDWSGFAALAAVVVVLVELMRGELALALAGVAVAAVTGAFTRYWSVTHPSPMPHLLRWSLLVPRGTSRPST